MLKELTKSGLYEVTHKESEEMKKWRDETLLKAGEDRAKREIAARLLELGNSVDDIVKITKLRKSSVEKMRREMGR